MKILFIVPYTPSLIRVRPLNLIQGLARRGHQLTLATTWTDADDLENIRQLREGLAEVHVVHLPRWRSLLSCALTLPTSFPLQAAYSWHPELARTLGELLECSVNDPFDVIHVEHLRGAYYARFAQTECKRLNLATPVIWDSVDCITHLFNQTMENSVEFRRRVVANFELERTKRLEKSLSSTMDRTLVTSPSDQKAILELSNGHQLTKERVTVLPNGVDLKHFFPNYGYRSDATVVLSGKMSYHANVAMVDFFVQEILPGLRQRQPQVRVQIVGKEPPAQLQALDEDPNIEVTGFVPDMRPYLQQATVAVAPLTYGAGIQNKVLEAMACATPTVVSDKAMGSLTAVPERDLLIAESGASFAQAISELISNHDRRNALGKAGRTFVERNHNWDDIAADLEEIYRGVNGH